MPVDLDSFPIRLFVKSQERAWAPTAIDYSHEASDWLALDDDERQLLLRLVSGFLVGERGVTHELAPLQQALRRRRGNMEAEMYVTAQMFEEARHVEFFQRWIDAALPGVLGRDIPYPELEGDMFSHRLPAVMEALSTDATEEAIVRAVTTYHMVIEGVNAEASYPIYFDLIEASKRFPALAAGIRLIRRDEARHIAFGTWLLQTLVERDPPLREVFEAEMESLRPYALGLGQIFEPFGDRLPFGLVASRYAELSNEHYAAQLRAIDERVLA
ncbi:MAG TPA: ribonucleotide-diphosphate reductase subunit beta [Thermoanaerobaculia bacterium]|nr:ribonucleotide-diphosphate reductase subunit beta [Thermoanaerobaculia bacterium]